MSPPDPLEIACLVTARLEALGVPYVLGGSIASAVHGEPRFTKDVDIAAALEQGHVDPVLEGLDAEFFVDRDAVVEAIEHRRLFQATHRATFVKVDVFVPPDGGLDAEKWARRVRVRLPAGEAWVTDPESILLQKLRWYREGGEVSDQQWRDVLGVMKVQGDALDLGFLRAWALELDVVDLLARALDQSGIA